MIQRYLTVLAVGVLLGMATAPATADLPPAGDLQADAAAAAAARVPLMVFFSMESCRYCESVRELYLEPMYAAPGTRRVLLRVVHVDSRDPLRDFEGRLTDHHSFAVREGATFAPTLRFYDRNGRQLTPEIVGYSSPDFFAGYLDDSIESALAAVRRR